MQTAEYETMFAIEDYYWWYAGLVELVLSSLRERGISEDMRVLDAGCGTGGLLARLRDFHAFGVEIADAGLERCRRRCLAKLAQGSVTALPFQSESFDAVISLDVLYHRWIPDDADGFRELHRVLTPGGTLILNLPAYQWLRSAHDEAVFTARRYTRRGLAEKLQDAGFRIVRLTYRNTLLFPAALALRLVRRTHSATPHSDLVSLPAGVNRALTGVLGIENRLLQACPLPFGLSVFCVAERAESAPRSSGTRAHVSRVPASLETS